MRRHGEVGPVTGWRRRRKISFRGPVRNGALFGGVRKDATGRGRASEAHISPPDALSWLGSRSPGSQVKTTEAGRIMRHTFTTYEATDAPRPYRRLSSRRQTRQASAKLMPKGIETHTTDGNPPRERETLPMALANRKCVFCRHRHQTAIGAKAALRLRPSCCNVACYRNVLAHFLILWTLAAFAVTRARLSPDIGVMRPRGRF
jgi:hypothetical protein